MRFDWKWGSIFFAERKKLCAHWADLTGIMTTFKTYSSKADSHLLPIPHSFEQAHRWVGGHPGKRYARMQATWQDVCKHATGSTFRLSVVEFKLQYTRLMFGWQLPWLLPWNARALSHWWHGDKSTFRIIMERARWLMFGTTVGS
jgi:hypothetical protein